ncbi:hypothetical protein GCM10025770_02250 [Viridibacterium curvum]|uniref:Uncharacterized protein n=1 Tax=Viridibacterium curvum TaxID=1101404 RepID=A0ABP9Q7J2_9RHOO
MLRFGFGGVQHQGHLQDAATGGGLTGEGADVHGELHRRGASCAATAVCQGWLRKQGSECARKRDKNAAWPAKQGVANGVLQDAKWGTRLRVKLEVRLQDGLRDARSGTG